MSIYAICRISIAFVWLYQGLVPKLLGPHHDELAMNRSLGLSVEAATQMSMIAGTLEIIFGVLVLVLWRQRWPLYVTAVLMLGLLLFVIGWIPALLLGAFNPVTTNLAAFALALIAIKAHQPANPKQQQPSA